MGIKIETRVGMISLLRLSRHWFLTFCVMVPFGSLGKSKFIFYYKAKWKSILKYTKSNAGITKEIILEYYYFGIEIEFFFYPSLQMAG